MTDEDTIITRRQVYEDEFNGVPVNNVVKRMAHELVKKDMYKEDLLDKLHDSHAEILDLRRQLEAK